MVVWGEEYRNYFLEYCLPSLLSPKNIPSLAGRRPAKYLIASTREDWEAISATAIFRALERHIEPVFVELPAASAQHPYWMRAIIGHRMCCDMAFADRAYRVFTAPDAMYSDGMVERFDALARNGVQAVMKLVVPLAKSDAFFATLARLDMLPRQSARDSGQPLTCTARQLARVSIAAMHGNFAINEWDAPFFCGYASTPWWRVAGNGAVLTFGLRWDILLVDYAAVPHDASILNRRGFDGDYIMSMVGNLQTIYFVRDSDDVHVVSWASYDEQPRRLRQYGEPGKGVEFRASAYGPEFNSMQRDCLFLPAIVHGDPLNGSEAAVEERALRTLLTWVDRPADLERMSRNLPAACQSYWGIDARIAAVRLPWWRSNPVAWKIFRIAVLAPIARLSSDRPLWSMPRIPGLYVAGLLIRRAILALTGDRAAMQWWLWVFRKVASRLLRRPFNEPRPEI